MFTELPLSARYKAAKEAGFQCVETGFPFGLSVQEISNARKEAGVVQVLLNAFTGKHILQVSVAVSFECFGFR